VAVRKSVIHNVYPELAIRSNAYTDIKAVCTEQHSNTSSSRHPTHATKLVMQATCAPLLHATAGSISTSIKQIGLLQATVDAPTALSAHLKRSKRNEIRCGSIAHCQRLPHTGSPSFLFPILMTSTSP
jgi:hypothetical protein